MDLITHALENSTQEHIDMVSKMEKIAVQRPYFAFDRLCRMESDTWDIWGDFVPEQPLGHEVGPLAIAEAGRHLAILGSCAAALAQPAEERICYLAVHAFWALDSRSNARPPMGTLTARAQIVERSRKKVTAETELICGGSIIGTLRVEYQVLSEKLFDALFNSYRQEEATAVPGPPYTRPLGLSPQSIKRHAVIARSDETAESHCAGHFPHYPMWPVAVVMYGLTQVFSLLLQTRLKQSFRFKVLEAEVHAHHLVSGHERVTFYAGIKSLGHGKRMCRVRCVASREQQEVAILKTKLALEVTRH